MSVVLRHGGWILAALVVLLATPYLSDAAEPARPASISVVIDDNYPPFAFRDHDGRLQGIRKDMWDLWSARTGIAVDLQGMDWNLALKAMAEGRADVIDTIFKTEARQRTLSFSAPYATIDVAIFFHRDLSGVADVNTLRGFTVGVKEGDACADWLAERQIDNFRPYPSYEAMIDAAGRREVLVYCIDLPPALYFLNKKGLRTDFRYTEPLFSGRFHWAVRAGNESLQGVLSRGFAAIAESEAVEERWFGRTLGIQLTLLELARWLLPGVAALAILMLWNWLLRRRVVARTEALAVSEERCRTIFDSVNDAIFLHDVDSGAILVANRRMVEMYRVGGRPLGSITVADLSEGTPPYSAEDALAWMRRATAGQPQVFEWHARSLDGDLFWVEVSMRRAHIGNADRLLVVVRDISERRAARARLENELAQLTSLIHSIPDMVWLKDPRGVFLACNARFERMVGVREADIIGKTDDHIVGPELAEFFRQRDREAMAAGRPVLTEEWAETHDGRRALLETVRTTLRSSEGTIVGVIGIARDITRRRTVEAKVEELSRLNTAVISASAAGILAYRGDGACVLANEAAGRIVGATCDQLLAQNFRSIESWRRSGLLEAAEAVLATGEDRECATPLHRSSFGKPIALDVGLSRFTKDDEPHLLLVIRDVTQEKSAKEALRASEERYRSLVESQSDFVIRLDMDGRFTFVNDAIVAAVRQPPEQILGKPWQTYVHPDDIDMTARAIAGAASAPAYRAIVESRFMLPGGPRWVAWEGGSIHGVDGGVVEIQAVGRDVTEPVDFRERLKKLVADLDGKNHELEQFAYVASHDLREPLRMVSSFIALLERRYGHLLDAEGHEFIAFARDGAKRMDQMILDLLEFSRVGRMSDPFALVPLADVVDTAVANLGLAINETSAEIAVTDGLPTVRGSRGELIRLVQNLIGNALKYRDPSRPPKIAIAAQAGRGEWVISVTDNGIGIAPEYFERIFGIFQRLHTRDQYDGTGIGLAVCRKIVQHHGGRLWVESPGGDGSRFLFSLPASASADTDSTATLLA